MEEEKDECKVNLDSAPEFKLVSAETLEKRRVKFAKRNSSSQVIIIRFEL